MYRYAATLCGGDSSATEALVGDIYRGVFDAARTSTSAISADDLLTATRRRVLDQLNAERGDHRRLRLVPAVAADGLDPRAGFEEELLGRVQGDWHVGSPNGWRSRFLIAVVLTLGLLVVAFGVARHDSARPVSTRSVTSNNSVSSSTPTVVSSAGQLASPVDTVAGYLSALAAGRFAVAAGYLGGGPVTLDRRADLRPIFSRLGDIAGALAAWCAGGALCRNPTELVDEGTNVRATFEVEGTDIYQSFPAGTYQGKPFVRGLPMIVPTPLKYEQPFGLGLVLCPTANVVSVTPADLDGDGWYEQIVLQHNGRSSGWSVTVCGTYLNTPLRTLPPYPDVRIYPVNVTGTGADVLLVGNEDASARFRGRVWAFDRGKGGASSSERNFEVSPIAGSNLGCFDVTGDIVPDLVKLDLQYVDGKDVTTSSAVTYTAVAVWPEQVGATIEGRVGLWPHSTVLPESLDGYCGDRPIVTS